MIKNVGIYLFFLTLFIASCHKVGNTTATILVRDESKKPIAGASVLLAPNSTDPYKKIDSTYVTLLTSGSDGTVTRDYSKMFKLGQAGAGVMDITATKMIGSDLYEGTSHVVLEPEQNNQAIVTLTIQKKQ